MIHHHLLTKYPWYAQWHQHKYHSHLHWLSLSLVTLISVSVILSGWSADSSQINKLSFNLNQAQAQTDPQSTTFVQRQTAWLQRNGKTTNNNYNCDRKWVNWMGEHLFDKWQTCSQIFAWVEKGIYSNCSSPYRDIDNDNIEEYACVGSVIDYLLSAVSSSGSYANQFLMRLLYQYKDKLSNSEWKKINDFYHQQIRDPYLFSRVDGDVQPQQTAARYLYSLGDKNVRVKWSECNYYKDRNKIGRAHV